MRLAGLERDLEKQTRLLREALEKVTLQSETIETQKKETTRLQDQRRRQQQVIKNMEAL